MAATEAMETTEETTKTATKQGDISEAVNHLVQGKRHMLVQDYVSAVSSLEKACKLFADHYGETAKECGDPYLHYGKALLELSRMETGVLGHALQGVESEEDEDEEEAESDDKDSKDSDDQVENPDNVTGDESGEERELIIQQVGEALLENACELEKKMTELKGDKSGNLEVNGSASNLSNSKTKSMEIETTSTESKDIPIMPKKAESQDDVGASSEKSDEVEGHPSKDKTEDEKPQDSEAQNSEDKSEVQMDEKPDDQKPTADLKSDDEKPASDIKSEEEKPVSDIVLASDIKPEEKPGSDIKSEEKLSSEETNDEKPTSDLKSEEKSVSDIKPDEEKPTSDGEKPASDIKTDEEKPKSDGDKPEPEKEELKSDEEKPKPEKEELKSDEEKPKTAEGEPASDLKSDEDKPKPDEEKPSSDLKPDTEMKPTSDLKSDEEKSADSNLTEVTTTKGEAKSEDNSKSDAKNIPAGDSDDKKDVKTDVEEMEVLEVESTTKDDKSVPKLEENIPKDIDEAKSEMKVPSGTHSLPDSKDAKTSTNAETDAKEKGSRNVETETNLPKAQSSSDSAQTKENDTKIAQDEEPMEIETSHPESKTQGEDQDGDGDESESIDEKSQDEEAVADDDEAAGPSDSGPSETKEKEDEVTNLQLAWEVLELAKVIFDRQADKDDKMKLQSAEVLLKLGEVSIESENYTQAIEDLNSCLDIQKKILTTDDRTVAETYYQLGLAFSLDNQFDNAVEHFTNAIRVLEERIANCRQLIERGKKETSEGDNDSMVEDPLDIAKREIEELEALIPDIKTKIEDTEDMKKTTTEAMKEEALAHFKKENLSGDSGGDVSTSIQASPSKPTSDVSHLVKRKRKPEEDVGNDSKDEIKKSKSDVDNVVPEQITNGNKMNGEQKMEASTVEVNAS